MVVQHLPEHARGRVIGFRHPLRQPGTHLVHNGHIIVMPDEVTGLVRVTFQIVQFFLTTRIIAILEIFPAQCPLVSCFFGYPAR